MITRRKLINIAFKGVPAGDKLARRLFKTKRTDSVFLTAIDVTTSEANPFGDGVSGTIQLKYNDIEVEMRF